MTECAIAISPLTAAGGHVLGQPRVFAPVATGGDDLEPREVVIPAVRVRLGRLSGRKVAVDEAEARALALGCELDLDRRRARWHAFLAVPAPGVDEPAGRVELDVFAARRVSGDDLAEVDPAGPWIEVGLHALPADELLRVDEELPDRLRAGSDRDRALD
jgi:hypothetical protein